MSSKKPHEPKWTHPIHARGVRSPRLDVRGAKLLTDKDIHKYAKAGYYGTEVQAHAHASEPVKKKRNVSPLAAAKRLLKELLK